MAISPPPSILPASASPREIQRRSNGIASREQILDATSQLAGELGYDGTSISLVSERSGLPASSIYWHFKSKDLLIAAVIERSFIRFREKLLPLPSPTGNALNDLQKAFHKITEAWSSDADFLRLGTMLVLDRREDELTARTGYVAIRKHAQEIFAQLWKSVMPSLSPASVRKMATLTMATCDGLFVAQEVEGGDLAKLMDTALVGLVASAKALQAGKDVPAKKKK
ncbi:MAG: TetR/AcrR family transcriptional regulator [Planctomycetaceae bacterium]|jgi:AcrR family transcriptional regulator